MTALDDSASPVLSSVDRAPVPAVTRTGKKLNKWVSRSDRLAALTRAVQP